MVEPGQFTEFPAWIYSILLQKSWQHLERGDSFRPRLLVQAQPCPEREKVLLMSGEAERAVKAVPVT